MVNAIQFYDSKILFGDADGNNTDKIAFHVDCCCGGGCDFCLNGAKPAQIQVALGSIALIEPERCADCLGFNTNFVLDFHQIVSTYCQWRYVFAPEECDIEFLLLTAYNAGGDPAPDDYTVDVELQKAPGVATVLWRKSYGTSKPDCANFSADSISLVHDRWDWTGVNNCDANAATCAITTV